MILNNEWPIILAEVTSECVEAVVDDRPFDAEPWIMVEEKIGYENTKILFNDQEYVAMTQALDLFCHSAQHDRSKIGSFTIASLGKLLISCTKIIKSGSSDFPARLSEFK